MVRQPGTAILFFSRETVIVVIRVGWALYNTIEISTSDLRVGGGSHVHVNGLG